MLYDRLQSDWATETHIMDERDLSRFEFKISFGRMSYIATAPESYKFIPIYSVCWYWYVQFAITSSQSIVLCFRCLLVWYWVSLCVPFTISLIAFYFIMTIVSIIAIFTAILFILNCTFRVSARNSSGSANAHLPGSFRPRTLPLNIGLNMLPSNSFMSSLDSH